MSKSYYVYIITNYEETTFYVGVTSSLAKRIYEHKNKVIKGFSSKYNLNKLVHFEETNSIEEAIKREKKLKKWNREWKLDLIRKTNPSFNDLSDSWIDSVSSTE